MNAYSDKTAVGIITCNRPDFFQQCIGSIDPSVGRIYVVNSGKAIDGVPDHCEFIQCKHNPTPVGHAKNILLRKMMEEKDNEFLFLLEDDIVIKDNKVFEKYIETAISSGIWGQLAYGPHGNGNRDISGKPVVLSTFDYEDGVSVDIYRNSLAAFQLIHRNIIKACGFFPEEYTNAFEHVDHFCVQDIKKVGLPLGFCPDIHESWKYIEDIDEDHKQSVIRKSKTFHQDLQRAAMYFMRKHGMDPISMIKRNSKHYTKKHISDRLDFLETNYSKPEWKKER